MLGVKSRTALGVGGVGMNRDPYNDRAKSFPIAILDGGEANCLRRRVPNATGLHRFYDLRSDNIPCGVERRN